MTSPNRSEPIQNSSGSSSIRTIEPEVETPVWGEFPSEIVPETSLGNLFKGVSRQKNHQRKNQRLHRYYEDQYAEILKGELRELSQFNTTAGSADNSDETKSAEMARQFNFGDTVGGWVDNLEGTKGKEAKGKGKEVQREEQVEQGKEHDNMKNLVINTDSPFSPDIFSPNSEFSSSSSSATPLTAAADPQFFDFNPKLNTPRMKFTESIDTLSFMNDDSDIQISPTGPRLSFPVIPLRIGDTDPRFISAEYDQCIDLKKVLKNEKRKRRVKKSERGLGIIGEGRID